MQDAIRRVDLPSGGWWDLLCRPTWGHVLEWDGRRYPTSEEEALATRALASLTTAWSFGENISVWAIERRSDADLVAVLEVFQREVVPYVERNDTKRLAEQLFVGLVTGNIPEDFADVHIMASTGWSWQTLQETPADVVRRMAIYLAVKHARNMGGALELREQRHGQ